MVLVRSLLISACMGITAFGAAPVVRTVPSTPSDPARPHDTFPYRKITLKGTSSVAGAHIRATWDFGDGTPAESFAVERAYDVSAEHTYFGPVGSEYRARLTVTDTATGESAAAEYRIALREKSLAVEVNVAVDEALWNLHKAMHRDPSITSGWSVLAFERHGHLESGDVSNPYTETVAQGIGILLERTGTRDAAVREALTVSGSPRARVAPAIGGEARRNLAQTGRDDVASRLLALSAAGTGRPNASWVEQESLLRNRNSFDLDTPALLEVSQALRNHSLNGKPSPLRSIQSDTLGPIDWYAAEVTRGDSTDGVARTLVNRQDESGAVSGSDDATAQSLLILDLSPMVSGAGSVLNVSAQVSVTNTTWIFNRATGTYNANLTVTNTSAQAIAGPLNVGIVNLIAGATLTNGTGAFNGAPYVNFPGVLTLNPGGTATVQLKVTVTGGVAITFNRVTYSGTFPPAALSLTCPAGTGTVNSPYSSALEANGGVQAYTYSISVGSLPHNLALDPLTGAITGTPDTIATSNFTALVTDSAGGTAQTASIPCSIAIASANQAPVATGQTLSTNEDIALPITLSGTDADGNALTFAIVGSPAHGGLGSLGGPICVGNPSTCTSTVTYTPAANYNGPDSFTFRVNDGTVNSPAATITINITAVNDAPSFTKGPDQNINQNAGAQTVVGWATAISPGPPDESGQTVSFNVTGNTNAALFTVAPAISPNGTLTYTPANGQSGSATITITLSDNGGTANGGVNTSAPQTFGINIAVVNQPPSFTKGPDKTVLEDAGPQTFAGWATAISPGPASESGQTVNFNVTGNTNAGLFSAGPAVSSTGTLTFTSATNANGTATITIVAQDNGGTANGGNDTSPPQSFIITVTAVNDAPSFTKGSDQTVLEDAGAQTVVGWATAISAGPADESGQTLTFNITGNTNAGLFSAGPSISSTGTLTYTPTANTGGSATITITLSDNGGTANGGVNTSAPQTFVINVTDVNDPPSFTKGPDKTVLEDAGPQTFAAWATAISPGPPSESGQTVSFNVTGNTNAGLFSAGPAVSSTGTLTFTSAANANGTATITIVAQDNGGTANGGIDTSPSQSFVINVTAVNDAPSFTKGADQTVSKNAGLQTVNPWATAISKGPANESAQTVHFNITGNTNAGLFTVAPAVDASGVLTFTPNAASTGGVATITLNIQDDGGTANGGVDTSAPQTFTITIQDPPQITSATSTTFQPGKTGQSFTVNTTGFPTNASMSITETGALPGGVNFTNNNNGTATINGTPASGTAGNSGNPHTLGYALTITANNGVAPNATQNFTLNITCPVITVSGTTPLNLTFNTAMSSTYTQAGGNGTIAWTISGQPTNLTINGGSGQLSGTPNQTGTFNATVTATDAGGCQGAKAVTIAVGPNLPAQGATGVGNTQFFVTGIAGAPATPAVSSATGVLNGATPAGNVLATNVGCTSGGTINSFDGVGRFIFTPNVSATSATCTYTASSDSAGTGTPVSATASLTFTLNNNVWYVNHGIAGGDGRSNTPFGDFGAAANQLNCTTATANGDFIYVHKGSANTTGACALKTSQSLIGAGATLSVGGILTVTGAAANTPILTGTLTLANSVTVNGIDMSTGASGAITGTSVTGVNVTPRDVTTTTGTAVGIGGTGNTGTYSFRSVSSNGAANGISLVNTSGSFTVTGNGGSCDAGTPTCTGGRIQNTTGADFNSPAPANTNEPGVGVYLNNVQNVSLTRMHLNDHTNFALYGTNVTTFTMDTSLIDGTNGNNNATPVNDGSASFYGLFGTSSISNSTIKGGFQRNVNITNSSGTANITISNNTIRDTNTGVSGDDNLFIQADNTATVTAHVTGNTFAASNGDHLQTNTLNSATMTIVATGNFYSAGGGANQLLGGITIGGGNAGSTEHVNFNISNNGSVGSPLVGNIGGGAININQGSGGGTWQGQVAGNWIGNPGVANSGSTSSAGIRVENHSVSGTMKAIVGGATGAEANHVRQTNSGPMINFQVGDTGNVNATLDLTVMNNDVNTPGATSQHGILLNGGADSAGSNAICIDVKTNTVNLGAVPPNGGADIRLRQRNSSTVRLPGYGGANTDTAAVIAFESGQNTLTPAGNVTASTAVPPGGGFVGGGACLQPTVPN